MSEQLTIENAIEILGICEGDSIEDAKRAYKRQMHRSHPDRFPNDLNAQKQAATKFSQLKKCYQLIEDHYNLYGEMPFNPDEDSNQSSDHFKTKKKTKKDKNEEGFLHQSNDLLREPSLKSFARRAHKPKTANAPLKKSRALKAASILCLVGLTSYFVLNHPKILLNQLSDKIHTETDSSNLDYRVSIELDPKAEKPKDISASDQLVQEEIKAKAVLSKIKGRMTNARDGKTFTRGSSYNDVAEIHGPPDRSDQKTWYYNSSTVIFDDKGHVVDWTSDSSYPLAIQRK